MSKKDSTFLIWGTSPLHLICILYCIGMSWNDFVLFIFFTVTFTLIHMHYIYIFLIIFFPFLYNGNDMDKWNYDAFSHNLFHNYWQRHILQNKLYVYCFLFFSPQEFIVFLYYISTVYTWFISVSQTVLLISKRPCSYYFETYMKYYSTSEPH